MCTIQLSNQEGSRLYSVPQFFSSKMELLNILSKDFTDVKFKRHALDGQLYQLSDASMACSVYVIIKED